MPLHKISTRQHSWTFAHSKFPEYLLCVKHCPRNFGSVIIQVWSLILRNFQLLGGVVRIGILAIWLHVLCSKLIICYLRKHTQLSLEQSRKASKKRCYFWAELSSASGWRGKDVLGKENMFKGSKVWGEKSIFKELKLCGMTKITIIMMKGGVECT